MSDLWLIALEEIENEFDLARIDEQEARQRLQRLGLDRDEVDEHILALRE